MENTTRPNVPSNPGMSNPNDGAVNKVSASAHAAVNSLAGAATGAADEAARRAKPAIDQVASMAHQAVDGAANVAAPAADWLAEQGDNINATQKKLVEDTCNYVSANPLKSVAIAVAAGFLLSRIMA